MSKSDKNCLSVSRNLNGAEYVPPGATGTALPTRNEAMQHQGGREGHSLKVISWNVNGLKRKLGDCAFLEYISSYDLIFLSETWISKTDSINLDIDGYHSDQIFYYKSKNTAKGRFSGGISFYYRTELKKFITVVEKQQFGLIWVKILADLFPFEENVYLCHIYMPPNDSKVFRRSQIDFFRTIGVKYRKYDQLGKSFHYW